MALGICRECGKEVSSEAKTCPHCGVKQPIKKSNTGCLVALGVLVVLMIIGSLSSHSTYPTQTTTPNASTAPPPPSATDVPVSTPTTPAAETPTPWVYNDSTDEMRNAPIHIACTESVNQVQLGSIYGDQYVELCIRQHPRFGEDVFVRLQNEGQFLCTSYEGCTVRVRFGDSPVATYSASGPSDGSTTSIFISNHSRFIHNLKTANEVIVEAEFYQAGNQQMDFPTNGLVWPRP